MIVWENRIAQCNIQFGSESGEEFELKNTDTEEIKELHLIYWHKKTIIQKRFHRQDGLPHGPQVKALKQNLNVLQFTMAYLKILRKE